MRKWWIFFAAGAVVVGCAGGSGLGTGTTGSGATTGGATTGGTTGAVRSVPRVELPGDASDVRVVYLSGQQRRAAGSQYAKLNNIRLATGDVDQIPGSVQGTLDGVNVKLDGYTVNKYAFGHTLPTGIQAARYTQLRSEVWRLVEELPSGAFDTLFTGSFTLPNIPVSVPLARGRQSTVQVFLNDAALFHDGNNLIFDETLFNEDNFLDVEPAINGYFSDMVSFDLSGVPAGERPQMQSGGNATKLMLTGDAWGVANGVGTVGSFDIINPGFIESGVLTNPVVLPDGTAPGTYTVLEPDPSVIPPTVVQISALQGLWRDSNEVLKNLSANNMVIFPTTRANGQHQVVAWKRSGSSITKIWIGRATLTGTTSGTVELWSADQLDNGTETGKVTGTLTNFTVVGGVIKDGDFTFTTPPTGFVGSGSFAVFAK